MQDSTKTTSISTLQTDRPLPNITIVRTNERTNEVKTKLCLYCGINQIHDDGNICLSCIDKLLELEKDEFDSALENLIKKYKQKKSENIPKKESES